MAPTSILVALAASLMAEPVTGPSEAPAPIETPETSEPPQASASPDVTATHEEVDPPELEPDEPSPTGNPDEVGDAPAPSPPAEAAEDTAPACRRADFESFYDYVDCRSRATGVAPPGPFAVSDPPPVRPTTMDPTYLPELHHADDLQKAGGTMLALGLGSLATAGLLNMLVTRNINIVFDGLSPGPLGFPATRWSDLAKYHHRAERLYVASLVTLSIGAVLTIAGTTTLGIGTARKRWARQHTIEITPSGLSLRW